MIIDFTIVLNQTTYTIAEGHSLALTGIPLVQFTVFISEIITSTSLTLSWSSTLSSTSGSPTSFFTGTAVEHPFPASFTPPLVDSNTIMVAAGTGPNAPPPGNYTYDLLVTAIAYVGGIVQVVSDISEVTIQLIECKYKILNLT